MRLAMRGWRTLVPLVLAALAVAGGSGSRRALAQPSPTAVLDRIRDTGDRPIDFHAALFPDTVYVGQQVTYQVAVLLSADARSRLRRNPEFLPPELRGLLAFELGTPTRVGPRSYGGRMPYEAHVFQRALFGVTDGPIRVPAPQLTYSLPQSTSYFSREERFVVRAESAQLVVRPVPLDGRPADFTGAVGVLRATARFDSSAVRVGDPLLLTVRIEGIGNVRLLPRPVVELSWATLVPGSERVEVDSTGALVRGAKEFDFLLTPTRAGRVTLPVVRYPYFDPYRERFDVAETAPADLPVAAGELAPSAPAEEGERLGLRPWRARLSSAGGERGALLPWVGLLVALAVPVPAVMALVQRARRRRTVAGIAGRPLAMPAVVPDDESPAGRARRARRTLLAQLANRLHVAATMLVTRDDLERVLRRRGVTRTTTRDVLRTLDDLAVLGFGGTRGADLSPRDGAIDAEVMVARLLERVHAEAVPHGRGRLWGRRGRRAGTVGLGVLLLGTGLVGSELLPAQPAPVDLASEGVACQSVRTASGGGVAGVVAAGTTATALDLLVGEATAAYAGGRFASAAERFARAVRACPRDADLLTNWGTAAWAAHDTVATVLAWQRAARLEPLAADLRERLALLPAGARGGVAEVPMVPVPLLMGAGGLAWCIGWLLLLLSWRRAERRGAFEGAAAVALLVAVSAAVVAWWGARDLAGERLAVVLRPETTRTTPGLDTPAAGGVMTGDVVRVVETADGWARVRLDETHEGWLPAGRLTPLVDASVAR